MPKSAKASAHRYSRGTFQPHPDYIRYMEETVAHPAYAGMPNAKDESGRVNWQVSSGKTTSFYKFYLARGEWWAKKADELKLPGTGNSDERFSIAARLIHPTKFRPCRLCGVKYNVGYFYLNKNLAKRWTKKFKGISFTACEDVTAACAKIESRFGRAQLLAELAELFPERGFTPSLKKEVRDVFLGTVHLRSNHLSPGFMCNPPDRLDGFHDYAVCCRKTKDPGRSDENLRSYLHDRRSFEWWAEGNWKVADSLYNAAAEGACCICGKVEEKISPDHVGPLACGFKQIPLFRPMCRSHNSSKNRRFTLSDVEHLLDYENRTGDSCASWQVRAFWDGIKGELTSEEEVKRAGSIMRGIQDYFLRFLFDAWGHGGAQFISYFLRPEYAYLDVEFKNLNASEFSFDSFELLEKRSKGRASLEARAIRIAFESLAEYASKELEDRKFAKFDSEVFERQRNEFLNAIAAIRSRSAASWQAAVDDGLDSEQKEAAVTGLLANGYQGEKKLFAELRMEALRHFDAVGRSLARAFLKSRITEDVI